MADNIYKSSIGTGVTFPIELTKNSNGETGWYPVVGDTKLIDNNLEALFIHQLGQRFREEDFGTRLWECIEEGNTQAQAYLVNAFIKEAIDQWESRITYKSTTISIGGSKLILQFHFTINNSSVTSTRTLVYDTLDSTLNNK